MNIKEKYNVESIPRALTKEWLLYKHYAKRMPMAVEYAFGLYTDNILKGVCVFGPTAPPVPITVFGSIKKHKVRELTRLITDDNLEKNVLSYFLMSSIKMLPKPLCLVSFADSGSGHHGYIYQSTNWIYTGKGGGSDIYYDENNNELHLLTINDRAKLEKLTTKEYCKKYNISKIEASPKYRYLYFIGSKSDTKRMKKDLLLKQLQYPKGRNINYDASYKPTIQGKLF